MKTLLKFMLLAAVMMAGVACNDDTDTGLAPTSLDVTYVNVAGIWKLTSWRGEAQTDNPYMYIVLDRRDHKFEIYQNTDSGKSRYITGVYTLKMEDDKAIITGLYDHASGFWNHDYFVGELTANQMTWTITDNAQDVSIYTRCAEVPEDIIKGTRAE